MQVMRELGSEIGASEGQRVGEAKEPGQVPKKENMRLCGSLTTEAVAPPTEASSLPRRGSTTSPPASHLGLLLAEQWEGADVGGRDQCGE